MEEKHGYFKPVNTDYRGYTDQFECTNCLERVYLGFMMQECEYEYCPHCAAIMDLESEKDKE